MDADELRMVDFGDDSVFSIRRVKNHHGPLAQISIEIDYEANEREKKGDATVLHGICEQRRRGD